MLSDFLPFSFFCSIHFHWNCLTISIVNELSRNLYFSFFLFSIRNSTPMNFSHLLGNAHSKWLSIDSFNRILNLIKLEHFFQLINYPWYVALKTLNLLRAFLINKNSMKWLKLYKVKKNGWNHVSMENFSILWNHFTVIYKISNKNCQLYKSKCKVIKIS